MSKKNNEKKAEVTAGNLVMRLLSVVFLLSSLASCDAKRVQLSFRADEQFLSDEKANAATHLEIGVGADPWTSPVVVNLAPGALTATNAPVLSLIPEDSVSVLAVHTRLYQSENLIASADVEAQNGSPSRTNVILVATCQTESDCVGETGDEFCNGRERCICPPSGCSTQDPGICDAVPPCSFASCVDIQCDEVNNSCALATAADLDHSQCPIKNGKKQFCHPQDGCKTGIPCNSSAECSNDDVCDGLGECTDEGQCQYLEPEGLSLRCGEMVCSDGVWRVRARPGKTPECASGRVCAQADVPFFPSDDDTLTATNIDLRNGVLGLQCKISICGDGVVDVFNKNEETGASRELCDPRVPSSLSKECNPDTCQKRRCGDGVTDQEYADEYLNEECDGQEDCHPFTCRWNFCGDGFRAEEEECDDGNTSDQDACLSICELNQPNDGYHNLEGEECDDGNDFTRDGCNAGLLESWSASCLAASHQVKSSDLLSAQIPESVFMDQNGDILLSSPAEGSVFRFSVETDRTRILDARDVPINERVAPTISLVAGSNRFADDGDGDVASEAGLLVPFSVATDAAGSVFIVDKEAGRVRKVSSDGKISTLAGNGKRQTGRDLVPALSSGLDEPVKVAIDGQGNTYVAELSGYRVRRIDAETGLIDTVFGARYDENTDPNDVDRNVLLSTRPDFGHEDCRYPTGADPRGLRFYKVEHVVMLPNDDLVVQTSSIWPVFAKDVEGNLLSEKISRENNDDVFIELRRLYYLHQNEDQSWSHFIIGNPNLYDENYISEHGLELAQHRYYLDPVQDLNGVRPNNGDIFQACSTRNSNSRSPYSSEEKTRGDLYFHLDSTQLNVDSDGNLLFSSCKYGNVWRVALNLNLENAAAIASSAIPELLYDSGLDESIPNDPAEREAKLTSFGKCFSADNLFETNGTEVTDLNIQEPMSVLGHPSGGVLVRELSGLFKWVLGPGGAPFVVDGTTIFPYFGRPSSKENNGLLLKIAHSAPGGVGLNAAEGDITEYVENFAAFVFYDENFVVQFSTTGRAEVFGANPLYPLQTSAIAGAQYDAVNSVSLDELEINHPTSVTWDGAGNKYVADSDGLIRFFAGGDLIKDKGELAAGLEKFRAYTVLGAKDRAPVLAETLDFSEISFSEPSGLWFVPGTCKVNDVKDDTQCVIFDKNRVQPCSIGSGADGCVRCKSSGRCVFDDGNSSPSPVIGDHLLVADTGNHRILDVDLFVDDIANPGKYTSTAKTIIGTGSPGTTDLSTGTVPARLTSLNLPVSVIQLPGSVLGFDVDDMQVMLVVDRGNHVIHIFAEGFLFSELTLLKQFGVPGVRGDTDVMPAPICIGDDGKNVCKLDPQQPPPGGCDQCLPSLVNARFRYPIGITPSSFDFINSNSEVTLYVSDAVDRVRALSLDVSNPLSITGTLSTIADGSLRPSDGVMERIAYSDGRFTPLPGAFLRAPQAVVHLPSSTMMTPGEERQEWLIADGSSGRIRRLTRSFDRTNGVTQHSLQTVLGFPRGQRLKSGTVCSEIDDSGCVHAAELNRLQDVRGLAVVNLANEAVGIFASDPRAGILYFVDVPTAFSALEVDSCDPGESWIDDQCVAWNVKIAMRSGTSDASLPTIAFADFSEPTSLAYDEVRDELYVADRGAHVVWKIQNVSFTFSTGISPENVSVLLGDVGQAGFEVLDGESTEKAEDIRLFQPEGLLFYDDHLFISDTGNHRVLSLNLSTLDVNLVIGTGIGTNAGRGIPAHHMPINTPRNMAVDASGSLLIAAKDRIRVVAPGLNDDDGKFYYGSGAVSDLMQNGGFAVGNASASLVLDDQCLGAHDIQCLSGVSVFYEDNLEKVMAFDSCQAVAFIVEPVF